MTEVATHPTLDEIAAYHAGTLPPEDEARLQEHFIEYRRCTSLLLEREELRQEIETPRPAEVGEDTAAWNALRARLPQAEHPREPAAPRRPTAAPPRTRAASRSLRWLPALAASLLVATVALSAWNASLRRRLAEIDRPQVNTPIHEIASAPLRGGGQESILELDHGIRSYTLVLRPSAPPPPDSRWAVEIARTDGGVEWRGEGLRPNAFGSFTLTLSRALVGEGGHVIRLRANGKTEELRLRIVARG